MLSMYFALLVFIEHADTALQWATTVSHGDEARVTLHPFLPPSGAHQATISIWDLLGIQR